VYSSCCSDGTGIQELTGLIVGAFGQAIGAPRCALLLAHSDGFDYSVVRWHGRPDQDVELYLHKYGPIDPLQLATRQAPEGTVAADYDIYPWDR
jgi:hypothetical protein